MSSNTQSLRDIVAKAKAGRSNGKSNGLGPAEYNRRKNDFIVSMLNHNEPVVRVAACSDQLVPVTKLAARLDVEEDAVVLKAILMNPQLSDKAIIAFSSDARSEVLADDTELNTYILDRLS